MRDYTEQNNREALAFEARPADPDRFLTSLFAPPARRPYLYALLLFYTSLTKASQMVGKDPAAGFLRLAFWREAVQKQDPADPASERLFRAIREGILPERLLSEQIEGKEAAVLPEFVNFEALWAYAEKSSGALSAAMVHILGRPEKEAEMRQIGALYEIGHLLRTVKIEALRGRCFIPADFLAAEGLNERAWIKALSDSDNLSNEAVLAVLRTTAGRASALLPAKKSGRSYTDIFPPALLVVLARHDLRQFSRRPKIISRRNQARTLAPRLKVMISALGLPF